MIERPKNVLTQPRTGQRGCFAKETPSFLEINPSSGPVQKYFQISPIFNVLTPELFRYRTRHPVRDFCSLALGSFWLLCFSPRFCPESPGTLDFLQIGPWILFLA